MISTYHERNACSFLFICFIAILTKVPVPAIVQKKKRKQNVYFFYMNCVVLCVVGNQKSEDTSINSDLYQCNITSLGEDQSLFSACDAAA